MAERWTRERRLQHTRDVLLDAAEEVFARRGFEGASLDEIAEAAGYTRGAIYKHFGNKDELFISLNKRYNERVLSEFLEDLDVSAVPESLDLTALAKRWYEMQNHDARYYALAAEFNLYLLRNPEARQRLAGERRSVADMIASFIDEQAARHKMRLRIPSRTVARIVLAAGDGLELASQLDPEGPDLYEPFLEMLVALWEPAP